MQVFWYTVCAKSLHPIHIVTYSIKWVKTSWTYSINYLTERISLLYCVLGGGRDGNVRGPHRQEGVRPGQHPQGKFYWMSNMSCPNESWRNGGFVFLDRIYWTLSLYLDPSKDCLNSRLFQLNHGAYIYKMVNQMNVRTYEIEFHGLNRKSRRQAEWELISSAESATGQIMETLKLNLFFAA